MIHSFITGIPKAGKDPLKPASYCPVALLNLDLNSSTRLLSYRLSGTLHNILSKDQVGFLPYRQAGGNTRWAIDVIDAVKRQGTEMNLLSLDAEKVLIA